MNNYNDKNFLILTDFGLYFAVASMKSLILNNVQNTKIIDIDNEIKKFSIPSAAFVLGSIFKYLPKNSIIITVVDPGVGTKRKPIFIKYEGCFFVAPDNGIFDFFIKEGAEAYEIDFEKFSVDSVTFHGRDLFVLAALEIYYDRNSFFKPISLSNLKRCKIINEKEIIDFIDSFGNIKIEQEDICCIKIDFNSFKYILRYSKTFGFVEKNEVFGYLGSNKTLEIAKNLGSAKSFFEDEIKCKFYSKLNCICK